MKINKVLTKNLVIITLMAANMFNTVAQEEEKDKRPVPEPFASTMLIDNQTSVIPNAKGLQFVIHHRFGTFENGLNDLIGIYAPSNIRMGFNYGITDRLMVGIGTEKNNKAQELHWKYNIASQTRSNSMPVTITYYGNGVIDASDESDFGTNFKSIHRLSYFNQLIVSRKFSEKLSLLIAPGFLHFNAVDSVYQNQKLTLTVGGKFNIYNNINLLCEYDKSFAIEEVKDYEEDYLPEGNLGFAAEIATGTHTFQIVLAQYREIINQYNFAYNTNDLKDGWVLGFNLTVRFY